MINIELNVSYPGLTTSEELRLLELIRRQLQPFITTVACSMVRDSVGPDYEGDFLRSSNLEIVTTTIKVAR